MEKCLRIFKKYSNISIEIEPVDNGYEDISDIFVQIFKPRT